MKLIVSLFCSLVLLFGSEAYSKASDQDTSGANRQEQLVSPEVSLVILSRQFAEAAAPIVESFKAQGFIVQVRSFHINRFGEEATYVNALLVYRAAESNGGELMPAGEVVAKIGYDEAGNMTIEGMYYKDPPRPPPAGGVSN